MSELWADDVEHARGYLVRGAWHGRIGDCADVTGLVVKHPVSGAERVIYFDRHAKVLRSIPLP